MVNPDQTRLEPGDRVVVAGKRGSGKTTFINRLKAANPGLCPINLDGLNKAGWPPCRAHHWIVEVQGANQVHQHWYPSTTKVYMAREPVGNIREQTFTMLRRSGLASDQDLYHAKHMEALSSKKTRHGFVLAGQKPLPITPSPGRC